MRKLLLSVIAGFGISGVGFANATVLTIRNQSNGPVNCAVLLFNNVRNDSTVYHWYRIENGNSWSFNALSAPGQGFISAYRCESARPNDSRYWGKDGYACTTRGVYYVNPFYKANNLAECQQFNGQWNSFTRVYQFGNALVNLDP